MRILPCNGAAAQAMGATAACGLQKEYEKIFARKILSTVACTVYVCAVIIKTELKIWSHKFCKPQNVAYRFLAKMCSDGSDTSQVFFSISVPSLDISFCLL